MPFKDFYERIKPLIEYYYKHGTLEGTRQNDPESAQCAWLIVNLREEYRKDKLTRPQIELLTSMGMPWESMTSMKEILFAFNKWRNKYGTLKTCKQGSTLTINGEVVKMDKYLAMIKRRKKNGQLSELEIRLLDDMGFPWCDLNSRYEGVIAYAKKYSDDAVKKIPYSLSIVAPDGSTLAIGRQLYRIKTKFKEKELDKEEYDFFDKYGIFDKLKKDLINQYENNTLSNADYRYYRELGVEFGTITSKGL